MALMIRLELFEPRMQTVETEDQYNQLFTVHGTLLLLMFTTPLFAGFANVIMPLQISAPDVSFPRLTAFAFWMCLFGSLIATFLVQHWLGANGMPRRYGVYLPQDGHLDAPGFHGRCHASGAVHGSVLLERTDHVAQRTKDHGR